jgi:hypothetical protein
MCPRTKQHIKMCTLTSFVYLLCIYFDITVIQSSSILLYHTVSVALVQKARYSLLFTMITKTASPTEVIDQGEI